MRLAHQIEHFSIPTCSEVCIKNSIESVNWRQTVPSKNFPFVSLHQNPDSLKNRKACYEIWFISILELKLFSNSECDFIHWNPNQKTHFCQAMRLKRKQLCNLHQKQDSLNFPKVYVENWHISKIKLQNPDNDRLCFFELSSGDFTIVDLE